MQPDTDSSRRTSSVNSLHPMSSLSSSVSRDRDWGRVFRWFSLNSSILSFDSLQGAKRLTAFGTQLQIRVPIDCAWINLNAQGLQMPFRRSNIELYLVASYHRYTKDLVIGNKRPYKSIKKRFYCIKNLIRTIPLKSSTKTCIKLFNVSFSLIEQAMLLHLCNSVYRKCISWLDLVYDLAHCHGLSHCSHANLKSKV